MSLKHFHKNLISFVSILLMVILVLLNVLNVSIRASANKCINLLRNF